MNKRLGLVIVILTLVGVLSLPPLRLGSGVAYASPGIAFDATSNTTGTSASFSWSHSINAAGINRILIVGVSLFPTSADYTVTSVTYGGAGLINIRRDTKPSKAESNLWYLLNPAVGTDNVTVTLSGSTEAVCGAASYRGVDQATPLGTATGATGKSALPTVNVPSATGELVHDTFAFQGGDEATVGAGQTVHWNDTVATEVRGGGSTEPGAATVTMSWNLGGSDDWAITAVPLKPAPDISNSPDNYDFGILSEGSTPATGLTHFEVTNNSGYAVNITIGGTDMDGVVTWTLSDTATPGPDTYGLKAGLAGGSYNVTVMKNGPYNTLISNLADGNSQQWGLQLWAPTTFSDGGSKSGTVTLTATQA